MEKSIRRRGRAPSPVFGDAFVADAVPARRAVPGRFGARHLWGEQAGRTRGVWREGSWERGVQRSV